LLDTHVVLWWLADDRNLSPRAIAFIEDDENEFFVSSISVWEIVIKAQLGKIDADVEELRPACVAAGFGSLAFDLDDAVEVAKLPPLHRDPFDRALVAQARCNGLRLLTSDARVMDYGEPVMSLASLG
jgi:PIN domain nuclease of toxin-antitoxin system